jgi:hypothetical protein
MRSLDTVEQTKGSKITKTLLGWDVHRPPNSPRICVVFGVDLGYGVVTRRNQLVLIFIVPASYSDSVGVFRVHSDSTTVRVAFYCPNLCLKRRPDLFTSVLVLQTLLQGSRTCLHWQRIGLFFSFQTNRIDIKIPVELNHEHP